MRFFFMTQSNLFKLSLFTLTMSTLSFNLYASGFQINEHSAAGLGRSFAGEGAMNDTAAAAGRNAAALMMFDRPTLSIGATYIDPDVNVNGTSPHGNSLEANDIAPSAVVPNAHYVHPLNEKFAWGLSLTSNYGLSTEYDEYYPAGSLAGTTHLTTGNLNLNGAYRLNQHFSFGIGANAVYAKAKLTRHLGELNKVPGLNIFPSNTEVAYLKGDEWAYGWNAGILYEMDENNRFGLSYRSKIDINFKGDFHNGLPVVAGGTGGLTIPGELELNLPDIWEFSAYHKVDPKWAVHYGITYTGWSTFKELMGEDENGKELFYKEEGFKNNIRLALGTTHYYNKEWTFRAGIAFDDSAAPASKRSISIPDQDRLWLSAGTNYKFTPDASVDLGVAYMRGQKVKFTEKDKAGQEYEFTSKGTALMYAMNFNYSF
jgi:long-chain fatty acid transport protein